MIIDASLGRNNSCGCGCDCGCGAYPTCPTTRPDCGTGGNNAPDAFTVQLATAVTALPDGAALPHYGSHFPVKTENPDFHRPEFFGKITFRKA